jgi:quercetin dioxygenase-like cupin family protein
LSQRWAEPEWKEAAPGISCKLLATDTEKNRVSMLVRLASGTEYPPHRHAGPEELHLLYGELMIGDRRLYPGDYNRAEPGSADHRVWSETGCTCVLVTSYHQAGIQTIAESASLGFQQYREAIANSRAMLQTLGLHEKPDDKAEKLRLLRHARAWLADAAVSWLDAAYVAGFLGSANVLDVEVLGPDAGAVTCRLGSLPLRAVGTAHAGPGKVIVRPERISLATAASADTTPVGHNAFHGLVDRVVYLGPTTHVVLRLADGQTLLVAVPNAGEPLSSPFVVGCPVRATFATEAARLLSQETGAAPDPTEAMPDQRASAIPLPS